MALANIARQPVATSMQLKGLEKLRRAVDARLRRLERRVMAEAVQEFAEPIRATAEQQARALISRRVKVKTEIKQKGSATTVKTGPTREFFWVYFFEFGFNIRAVRKGPPLAYISPRPTLRPAYDMHTERGLEAMRRYLEDKFIGESQPDEVSRV